jgi:hypothetical protein
MNRSMFDISLRIMMVSNETESIFAFEETILDASTDTEELDPQLAVQTWCVSYESISVPYLLFVQLSNVFLFGVM